MNVLFPTLVGLVLLFIATRTYPFFLMKAIGVDDKNPPPSERFNDGRDYVPSKTPVVFAHHFTVIAGAGPIVGPTIALAFGFGPPWLWIVFGCILFGAVHDMTSMFVSMREDGRSIAEMSRRTLGRWGYFLFVAFLIMILTLINAIFLNLSCKALTSDYPLHMLQLPTDTTLLRTYMKGDMMVGRIGGIATTSVFVITVVAPFMGYLLYKRRLPLTFMYGLAAFLCITSVIFGFYFPVFLQETEWRYIMSAYVFIACWIPVWLILQPRDFVNVQLLYGGIGLMVAGIAWMGIQGRGVAADFAEISRGNALVGPIWPLLMITVACGAISGFHSLAASGTTVKQITSEQCVRKVGYNAMILEGALALLTLMLVATALPTQEYLAIVYPDNGAGNPILAFSISMGYMLHGTFGIPIAIGAVLGILVVEGFVVTTLDTAVRLCRYLLEEFWAFIFGTGRFAFLRNPLFNTGIAVGLMLFFALNSTIMSAWKIFGAGNQLIGALALTVVTVWLLRRMRPCWFTLIPAILMTATTFGMLTLFILNNVARDAMGPLVVSPKEKIPLVVASAIMLLLSIGVVAVSLHRFFVIWMENRARGLQAAPISSARTQE